MEIGRGRKKQERKNRKELEECKLDERQEGARKVMKRRGKEKQEKSRKSVDGRRRDTEGRE